MSPISNRTKTPKSAIAGCKKIVKSPQFEAPKRASKALTRVNAQQFRIFGNKPQQYGFEQEQSGLGCIKLQ